MASSQTPWTIRPHLPDAHFEVVADAAGNTVGTATRPADAALIVAAVNARAALAAPVRNCDMFSRGVDAVSAYYEKGGYPITVVGCDFADWLFAPAGGAQDPEKMEVCDGQA